MDLNSAERQALDDLRDVALRYCTEIEAVSQRTAIEFLRRMNQLLPELYWRASLLPVEVFEDHGDDGEDEDSEEDFVKIELPSRDDPALAERTRRYFAVAREVEAVLGALDGYQSVFDPFDTESAVPGTLSGDLAEMYMDLVGDLNDDASGADESGRLWQWREYFTIHWGTSHLPPALHAISWLLHQYWDRWDEKWDDEFLSRRNPGQI